MWGALPSPRRLKPAAERSSGTGAEKVAENIVRDRQRRTVTFPDVVTLPSHLRCTVKARSDEASRNYGTFCKNNPFIPQE